MALRKKDEAAAADKLKIKEQNAEISKLREQLKIKEDELKKK